MSEAKRCPQCQAEIPAGSPEGLCPPCLLQAGLAAKSGEPEEATAPFTPSGTTFVPPTPEALQASFPQLEMLELLGKGGMGAVYKARQPSLDRVVAVKILPPEISRDPAFAERFTREARALAKLSHPNIVAVYDFGQTDYCYFVMEYVDGVNLRQAMRAGELKAAEVLKIVPQICDALQFAHDEGIVHRDIKPENILLDKRGRVKIADFGLAKLVGRPLVDVSLTGTQQVMGTLHYMAPEQMEGSRDVDHRADIYSLGVTFYEMLTGQLPIGRFAPPSKKVQIDVRLDEVVLRSLEQEREQRYQHASEVKTDVQTIVSGSAAEPGVMAPISVPFDVMTSWFWGARADGVLRFYGACLELEIRQHFFGLFESDLKDVKVPLAEIESLELSKGWVFTSLLLRTRRWKTLVDVPGSSQAQVTLQILPEHEPAAKQLHAAVSQALQRHSNVSESNKTEPAAMQATTSPAPAPVKRPVMVPLLGALNVLAAVFCMFIVSYGFLDWDNLPEDIKANQRMMQVYNVYMSGETLVSYLGSVAWFAAGIGLMLWLSWARRLTIAAAVVNLGWFILTVPALYVFTIQPLYADAPPDPDEQFGYAIFLTVFVIVVTVLFLAYDIAVLIYLNRPHVIAAFARADHSQSSTSACR